MEVGLRVPGVVEVLESPNDELTEDQLAGLLQTSLPEYVESRLAQARSYFIGLVKEDVELPATADPLSLAIGALFSCNHCNSQHTFPEIMSHNCIGRRVKLFQTEKTGEFFSVVSKDIWPCRKVWSQAEFRSEAKRLRAYAQLYGMDPMSDTMEEMDAADARLTCPAHPSSSSGVVSIMTWQAAVSTQWSSMVGMLITYVLFHFTVQGVYVDM